MAITDGTSDRTAAAEEDENSTVTLTLPGGFDCNGQQFNSALRKWANGCKWDGFRQKLLTWRESYTELEKGALPAAAEELATATCAGYVWKLGFKQHHSASPYPSI